MVISPQLFLCCREVDSHGRFAFAGTGEAGLGHQEGNRGGIEDHEKDIELHMGL